MFNAKWVKPECRKRLVKRRHASPSATSAGTSAPSARTACGCSKSPLTNGAPTVGPAAATSTYTAAQTAIRPKVMGRREKAKRLRELVALYLADGVADLDLGYVLQRAAEHALKVRTVALSGGAEALDLNVLAEHLLEDALEVLLHLAEPRGAERRVDVEDASDGEIILDLSDLSLRFHVLHRPQGFAGVRVPDFLALGREDLEKHPGTDAMRAAPVHYDLTFAQDLCDFAFDGHVIFSL